MMMFQLADNAGILFPFNVYLSLTRNGFSPTLSSFCYLDAGIISAMILEIFTIRGRKYLILTSPSFHNSSRNSLMSSQRSSDGDKLTPSQTYSSQRGPLGLDARQHHHNHLLNQHHNNHHIDDDDKLLDVVGPSSPLLSSLQQMQSQAHGEI